jgi:5-methyltetrahydropteroyltriglutamate--homocysteine methyltransferase
MQTTTIGAFPKPAELAVPDWFRTEGTLDPAGYVRAIAELGQDARRILDEATRQAVRDQVEAGIDIPTDGEIRRENYIHHHCRHLAGIDFGQLTETAARGGAWTAALPTVVAPIRAGKPFLPEDWRAAQAATDRPVKITVPGPLTISDTIADAYYGDTAAMGRDLAVALNQEILALAEAGCRQIQVDEPVFARRPEEALAFGIENLERCFHGLPEAVTRTVHACCGYPNRLDQEDYVKAPQASYHQLAPALDQAAFDALSLEDAHRHNDLRLLEQFRRKTVVLGVVAIAKSRVESVEEIRARLQAALGHIDAARLMAAPDCGLGFLTRELALAKLRNLAEAAHSLD